MYAGLCVCGSVCMCALHRCIYIYIYIYICTCACVYAHVHYGLRVSIEVKVELVWRLCNRFFEGSSSHPGSLSFVFL